VSLIQQLDRAYSDRRDRYGVTILSRSRAIRAIKRSDDEAVRRLVETNLLDILVAARAILPARVIRGRQDDYVFLVQKRIRPAVAPSEWSPSMFADAALLILRAEKALSLHGMTVDDPHPWNVLFDEGKPYIVDMGAFNVVGTGVHWSARLDADIWPAGNVYNALFLNVVALVAAGRGHYVRQALTDWNPISGSDTALLLLKNPATLIPYLAIRFHTALFRLAWTFSAPVASTSQKSKLKSAYLSFLSRYVQRMRSRIVRRMGAVGRGMNLSPSAAVAIRTFTRQHSSRRFLVYGASRESVDCISAGGVTSLLVVSPDEVLIESLYHSPTNHMSVAVMDLRSPTPGAGPGNRWILPAFERHRSEVGVFCFDLKELVIDKCLTVSELVQAARELSKSVALIILTKPSRDDRTRGRDYGQTGDDVLLACLEEHLEAFEVIFNDSSEMVVTFSHNNPIRRSHNDRE